MVIGPRRSARDGEPDSPSANRSAESVAGARRRARFVGAVARFRILSQPRNGGGGRPPRPPPSPPGAGETAPANFRRALRARLPPPRGGKDPETHPAPPPPGARNHG